MFRITEVVKYLLIINVAIFLIGEIGLINTRPLSLFFFESPFFHSWQLVTHFFMHANLMHLFFNMFALVMFGSALEARWGPKRFLFFYFFCAFGAAALHTGYNYYELNKQKQSINRYLEEPSFDLAVSFFREFPGFPKKSYLELRDDLEEYADAIDNGDRKSVMSVLTLMNQLYHSRRDVPTVGASGAVYGLLLAFGLLFPNVELMLIFLPIPIKAKYFIPFLMAAELFLGINNFSWDNIAHFAHLGGALFGLILVLYWQKYGSRWGY
ncbi:MAG: rhomboid family intramembrane serine protease [Bacteroidota bacterium]